MVDATLINYVRQSLNQGVPTKDVAAMLAKAGWTREQIKNTVDQVMAELPTKPIIRIEGLSKAFNHKAVLDNVYLHIRKGEIFGIIGPSGAGKTTLLKLLVGYHQAEKGDIIIHQGKQSFSIFKNPQMSKRLIGFSTQSPSVYGKLTVFENLLHFGALYGLTKQERESRARALLHLVELDESQATLAANLSGGMQKRLDIACSLMHNPPILILDEPTADLDPVMRKAMWSLVKEINKKGTTIIMASHFLGEIENLCDRIAIVRNHTITEVGSADELKDAYTKNFVLHLETQRQDYKELLSQLQPHKALYESIEQKEKAIMIRTARPEETLSFIAAMLQSAGDKIRHVHVARPSMQELFMVLVKK